MKKSLIIALLLCCCAATPASAQNNIAEGNAVTRRLAEAAHRIPALASEVAGSQHEWLTSFDRVEISAAADVVLVFVAEDKAPEIFYDTKGVATKLTAEVRERVLYIKEKSDQRRVERTLIEVRCNNLAEIKVTDAALYLKEPYKSKMLDLNVGARARFEGTLEVEDLAVEASGTSVTRLAGAARYLTLNASTGEVDATALAATSAQVVADNKAAVRLQAVERLTIRSSTGATVRYKGKPELLRISRRMLSGEVLNID